MKRIFNNLDVICLVAGTLPMTYQYLTQLQLPILVNVCSIFAAISLEIVLIKQVLQQHINVWSTLSIIISTVFLVLISLLSFVPQGLLQGGIISAREYSLVSVWGTGITHAVFCLELLCVTFSKQYSIQRMHKGEAVFIEKYRQEASVGFGCDVCGKVMKSAKGLQIHKKRVH